MRRGVPITWVRGSAAELPFATASLDGAYATWAYFFTGNWDPTPGLTELHRVVRPGAPLIVVDNLGGDEFSTYSSDDYSADADTWATYGFACEPITTSFEFDNSADAAALFSLFFGPGTSPPLSVEFRVGLFTSVSSGNPA